MTTATTHHATEMMLTPAMIADAHACAEQRLDDLIIAARAATMTDPDVHDDYRDAIAEAWHVMTGWRALAMTGDAVPVATIKARYAEARDREDATCIAYDDAYNADIVDDAHVDACRSAYVAACAAVAMWHDAIKRVWEADMHRVMALRA